MVVTEGQYISVIKEAMGIRGIMSGELRLPLTSLNKKEKVELREIL